MAELSLTDFQSLKAVDMKQYLKKKAISFKGLTRKSQFIKVYATHMTKRSTVLQDPLSYLKEVQGKQVAKLEKQPEIKVEVLGSEQGLKGRYGDPKTWKQLGEGTFGQVFKAYDSKTKTTVVIKQMPRNAARSDGDFKNEVKVLRHLQSHCKPYLVCYVDALSSATHNYILMEFLGNYVELFDYINKRKKGTQSVALSSKIIGNLLGALQDLKKSGVAHRDIKPENIMIDESPANEGAIKLIDFGFSCLGDECNGEELLGTPGYLAPELLSGKKYFNLQDWQRADMWAMGCTIFMLLSNKVFVDAFHTYETPQKIARGLKSEKDAQQYLSFVASKDPKAQYAAERFELQYMRQFSPEEWRELLMGIMAKFVRPLVGASAEATRKYLEFTNIILQLMQILPEERSLSKLCI